MVRIKIWTPLRNRRNDPSAWFYSVNAPNKMASSMEALFGTSSCTGTSVLVNTSRYVTCPLQHR